MATAERTSSSRLIFQPQGAKLWKRLSSLIDIGAASASPPRIPRRGEHADGVAEPCAAARPAAVRRSHATVRLSMPTSEELLHAIARPEKSQHRKMCPWLAATAERAQGLPHASYVLLTLSLLSVFTVLRLQHHVIPGVEEAEVRG